LGKNINTIEKNGSSVRGWWEVGLKANTEETKYMVVSHHQNVGQNQM